MDQRSGLPFDLINAFVDGERSAKDRSRVIEAAEERFPRQTANALQAVALPLAPHIYNSFFESYSEILHLDTWQIRRGVHHHKRWLTCCKLLFRGP